MEYKDIKTIAKEIKQNLKVKYPKCKFSVSIKRYSGGQSLSIYLMAGDFEAFVKPTLEIAEDLYRRSYFQTPEEYLTYWNEQYPKQTSSVNHYHMDDDKTITEKAHEVMQYAYELTKKDNWDNSDIMTDYFDVNFYVHMGIGKWDKPYKEVL